MRAWLLVAVLAQVPIVALADDADSKGNALRKKGEGLLRAGDNEAALVQFKEAERVAPKNPDNARALAGCLARQGNFQRSAKYYRLFLELAPADDPSVPAIRKAVQDYDASGGSSDADVPDIKQPKAKAVPALKRFPAADTFTAEDEDAAKTALAKHDLETVRSVAQKAIRSGKEEVAKKLLLQAEAQNPLDAKTQRHLRARRGTFRPPRCTTARRWNSIPTRPSRPPSARPSRTTTRAASRPFSGPDLRARQSAWHLALATNPGRACV